MADFYIEKRIYYHDTDCGGVVYYANYLKHLEEARTEFCRHKSIDLRKLSREGTLFVVIRLEIDYKSPARYQDKIRIFTKVEKVRHSSLEFAQEIMRGDSLLIRGKTIWVCVGENFKPKPIPRDIKKLFLE